MVNHLIIGMGEVGTALAQALTRTYTTWTMDKDTGLQLAESNQRLPVRTPDSFEVIHICFPFSGEFANEVLRYQKQCDAGLVIVHSTVPVGTCDPAGWVHSPVRGRHPRLRSGIEVFTKHFGGKDAKRAANLFADLAIPTMVHDKAATTEAGKLWELVQFGIQVVVEKEIYQWCKDHGLDPKVVYGLFARTYNHGYRDMGEHDLARPVLAHMEGGIGGHCICEGSELLDHRLARMVTDTGWC